MAHQSQQNLYLTLCKAYGSAITKGEDHIKLPIGHLSDILEYLNGNDNTERLVYKPLDDYPNEDIVTILSRHDIPESLPNV